MVFQPLTQGIGCIHSYLKKPIGMNDPIAHYAIDSYSQRKRLPFLLKSIDAPAFTNLTRDYCRAFNHNTINRMGVYYASIAAVLELTRVNPLYYSVREMMIVLILFNIVYNSYSFYFFLFNDSLYSPLSPSTPQYRIISQPEGPNDGLVS